MGHAIRGIFYSLLQSLEANRRAILSGDEDPERLHQLRVSMRKMRVLFSLLHDFFDESWRKKRRKSLGKLMRATGPLRDLDVALERFRTSADDLEERERRGLEAFVAILTAERDAERRRLPELLDSTIFAAECEALRNFIEGKTIGVLTEQGRIPALPALAPILKKLHRKILRDGERLGKSSPDRAYHRLRIQVKKLRYLLEFFAPILDLRATVEELERLKTLQTLLGEHQDLTVQRNRLASVLKEKDLSDPEIREGLRVLRRRMKREALRKRLAFADAFMAFNEDRIPMRRLLCRD
jgi:CHAD domain-containing protein